MQDALILNRYRPISQVGSGGFSTVTLAWDTRIQRRVAIKMMQIERELVEGLIDADGNVAIDAAEVPGLDEARTAAMLTDPSIVGVLDFEIQGTTAYLIMEYVDGMTLAQLLRNHGDQITLDIVGAVFAGVAHALDVAHANQVLHLDIKPDNVMINRQGVVKVADFGMAQLSDVTGYVQAGGGTIGYMPLEQMRQEVLDTRCDEWALASLTYEMISGENPFTAPDLANAETAILEAELALPSQCMIGLDPEADDVLFYALDPDRYERYESVRDFAEELQPFLGNVKRGVAQLASIVGEARNDMPDAETPPEDDEYDEGAYSTELAPYDGEALFDQPLDYPAEDEAPTRRKPHAPLRVLAAATSGWLALNAAWLVDWPALVGLPAYQGMAIAAVVALLLAGLLPRVGALLVPLALAAALALAQLYVPCGVLVVATIAWWAVSGRRSKGSATAGLTPALFGAIGAGQFSPLAIGFLSTPPQAVANSLYATLLAAMLGAMGTNSLTLWRTPAMMADGQPLGSWYTGALWDMATTPATWITLATWLAAAVIMAALCGRERRWLGVIGAVLAGLVLVGGLFAATWVASGLTSYMPGAIPLAATIGCAVAGCVMAALTDAPRS